MSHGVLLKFDPRAFLQRRTSWRDMTIRIFLSNPDVVAMCAGIDALETELLDDELIIVRSAVLSRQHEFAAGRSIARMCLAQLGCVGRSIPRHVSRAPIWPAGFVGSISHCHDTVGAAVARVEDHLSIGFDIEASNAVKPDLFEEILTDHEIRGMGNDLNSSAASLIFSCKEAVYKAVHPLADEEFGFGDVTITLAGNRFTAQGDPNLESEGLIHQGQGYIEHSDDHVRTLFLVPHQGLSAEA
jgi:4'-phosphopantetheinyl transferase EntD